MSNFIQLINVVYNDVPHVKILNDVATSGSSQSMGLVHCNLHLVTLFTCDVGQSTDDIFDQTTLFDKN